MIGISKLYCGTVEPSDALALRPPLGPPPLPPASVFQGQEAGGGLEHHPAMQPQMRSLLRPGQKPGLRKRADHRRGQSAHRRPFRLRLAGHALFRRRAPHAPGPAGTGRLRRGKGDAGGDLHQRHPHHAGDGPHPQGHRPVLCRDQHRRHGRDSRPVPGRQRRLCRRHGGHSQHPGGRHQGGPAVHHQPLQRRRNPRGLRPARGDGRFPGSAFTTWSTRAGAPSWSTTTCPTKRRERPWT